MNLSPVLLAFLSTLFTWFITALGAATVVFFKKSNSCFLNFMIGFAAGVMIAASFFSLLLPAINQENQLFSLPSWMITTIVFLLGALFLYASDKAVFWYQKKRNADFCSASLRRAIMLVFSITLHNIPEGLAIGVAFGALESNFSPEALIAAVSVAVGIGLQNFPEGAAVSIPLRKEGYSRKRSFLIGQISGAVEPIAGVIGALLVIRIKTLLSFALSFAAGAMILVAVHELIPECQTIKKNHPYLSTMGIIVGFSVMMLFDVMLSE